MKHGSVTTYNKGCRCSDCTTVKTEYMRQYQARRRQADPGYYLGRKASATEKRGCTICGQALTTGGQRKRDVQAHKRCRLDAKRAARRRERATRALETAALGTTGGMTWTQGKCNRCGDTFCIVGTEPASYCSRRCLSRAARSRRKARERGAYVSDVNPLRVFEMDGYRCHLCGMKVNARKSVPHPLAPTIDHVIPLSRGGTHEPSNCRTAHFRCNYTKNAGGAGDQMVLFG